MTVSYKLSYCKKGGSHTIQADANDTPEFQKNPVHENDKDRYHGSALPVTVRGGVRSSCAGTHNTRFEFANLHLWLSSVIGSLTSSLVSAHYSHAIVWDKTKQALQLKELINSDIRVYNDVFINSMTISGDAESNFPEIALNVVALTRTDNGTFAETLSFSSDTHRYGVFSDISFQIDVGAGYIDFTECIKSFSIEISSGLTPSYCVNKSATPSRFKTAGFNVSCTFKLEYSDETFRDLFENATVFAIKFVCEDLGSAIETAVYPKVELELHENYILEHTKELDLRDVHHQTLKTMLLGNTNTPAGVLTCTVINEVA
jgi:hypothetical protein